MGDQQGRRTRGRGNAGRGQQGAQQRPGGGRGGPPPPQTRGPPPQQPQSQMRGPPMQAPRPSAWGASAPQQAPPVWGAGAQQQQAPPSWGPRPQPPQQPQTVRAPMPQAEAAIGRAAQRGGGDERHPGMEAHQVTLNVAAGGDSGNGAQGRGGMRGGREIRPIQLTRTRPEQVSTKQGAIGRNDVQVKLVSNFFELERMPNWTLYQYRVDFAPDVDVTATRITLMRIGMAKNLPGYIFDGTILYTPLQLRPDPHEVFVEHAEHGLEYGAIRITMRLRQDVVQYDALNIQIFNLIIRKCLRFLKLQLLKRSFYDPVAKVEIPKWRIEIWPGYETSIKQHENSVMLNVEVINKFMRIDTALDHLHDLAKNERGDYKMQYQKDLIGCVVITDYNNRTYRIDDVEWKMNPMSTFKKGDTEITFKDYFQNRYGKKVRDMSQPMLISRSKPREIRAGMPETVSLIPELCRMTGITNAQKANYQFMADIANITRISPDQRIDKLMRFSRRLSENADIMKELRQWDLKLANRLVEYSGRTLPPEEIFSASRDPNRPESYNGGQQANWTGPLRGKHMFSKGEMKSFGEEGGWIVMCPADQRSTVQNFVQQLQKVAQGMGWNLPPPKKYVHPPDDRPSTLCTSIDQYVRNFKPYFLFASLPFNKADKYNAIKKKCYVDYAIPSQIVLLKNMANKNVMSIATKVAIQMNCKIGGAPWTISMPVNNVMIVGFDVCHDSKNRDKSYGALVATLDKQMTQYFSCTHSHNKGEELSNYMGTGIVTAAKRNAKINNNKLPERIIIYRDGVGDGQLPMVYDHELKNVLKLLAELYAPNEPPKVAFIVVTKRITTRIFTANGQNPNPGTIVDNVITQPERYDFFLVSQCVRLGSVMPTSYNIIHDTTGWAPGNMQKLTYKLCHMFFNWSGTVRVPAPCQYAHKLAFMASQNLQRSPNPNLDHLLYFL